MFLSKDFPGSRVLLPGLGVSRDVIESSTVFRHLNSRQPGSEIHTGKYQTVGPYTVEKSPSVTFDDTLRVDRLGGLRALKW